METSTVGAPPCPCTQTDNTSTPLSIECRLSILNTNADRLNYRQAYSDHLHRKVGEGCTIEHYEYIAPQIIKAAAIGAFAAIGLTVGVQAVYRVFKK